MSVLEGFAAGLPCVTTNVGACRELVYGRGEEDRALGAAGAVVGLADYDALADRCGALLAYPTVYARTARAAIQRVERYYDQRRMIEAFDRLFAERIGAEEPR